MSVADFNGDGSPDLVIGDWEGYNKVNILHNDGSGNFTSVQEFPVTPGDQRYDVVPKYLQALDIGCDGAMDLIYTPNAGAYGPVHVMMNNGNGTINSSTVNTLMASPLPEFGVVNSDSDGDTYWDVKAGFTLTAAAQVAPVNVTAGAGCYL